MAKEVKRKTRDKLSKKISDFTNPITLAELGTDNDPCFGKHFDPKSDFCKRCGDSELCVIKMGQLNHTKRAKLEKEHDYRDTVEIDPLVDAKKKARKRMVELIKSVSPDKEFLINEVYTIYFVHKVTKPMINRILNKLVESGKVTITKNKVTWKSNPSK